MVSFFAPLYFCPYVSFSISPYVWWLLDIGRHALCSRFRLATALERS